MGELLWANLGDGLEHDGAAKVARLSDALVKRLEKVDLDAAPADKLIELYLACQQHRMPATSAASETLDVGYSTSTTEVVRSLDSPPLERTFVMVEPARKIDRMDTVKGFVSRPKRLLIGGEWIDSISGMTFPTYDPATGEVITQVAEGVEVFC